MIIALMFLVIFCPLILGTINFFISKKFPKVREIFAISIASLELIMMIIMMIFVKKYPNEIVIPHICGLELSFKADNFRIIYATVSIFLWLMTIIFSKDYMKHYINKDRYYFFYLLTLTGVTGVFFSNDFFTTFIFFELMSLASYPLVIHDEKEEAMKAGKTYLVVAIISGMVLLMGMFLLYNKTQTFNFLAIKDYIIANGVSSTIYASGVLMLIGFGAKAGMYPLHIWLPKAHPVAPAPASALLSGILTKAGIFGIIVLSSYIFFDTASWGYLILGIAVITMFFGALLALFSVDLKRTLACSSMSQIGFIMVGLAMMVLLKEHGAIGAEGALLHMINHSTIKLVLFMAAGLVAMNLHTLELNKIKGFGRKKPLFMIVFLIGALGIMGIPSFNGYISKTMIHESIVEYIHLNNLTGFPLVSFKIIEYVFLISGGLTIAYMTKLFVNLFIEKNNDEEVQRKYDEMKHYCSLPTSIVLSISALVVYVLGILPYHINNTIGGLGMDFFLFEPLTHRIAFYGWECLKGALISLVVGALVYGLIVRLLLIKKKEYLNVWPSWLDLEKYFYTPIIKYFGLGLAYFFKFISNLFLGFLKYTLIGLICFLKYLSLSVIYLLRYLLIGLLYIVKVLSFMVDGIIVLLNKTILKPQTYVFHKYPLSYRIGLVIDKLRPNKKNKTEHAEKFAGLADVIGDNVRDNSASFSHALGMICFGIVLVISITLVIVLV